MCGTWNDDEVVTEATELDEFDANPVEEDLVEVLIDVYLDDEFVDDEELVPA